MSITNEELKAAAERLRRWDAGEKPSAIYPHHQNPLEAADSDAWDLSRECRKRLAADERDMHAGEQMRALYELATGRPLTSHMRDAGTVIGSVLAKAKERLASDETDRAMLRSAITLLEEIVCVTGSDRGVVLVSGESPTHYDAGMRCQVYDHENFSQLGDSLIRLHEKLQGMAK